MTIDKYYRTNIYRFRMKNSADIRYIQASTLHEASTALKRMGFEAEYLSLEGELVVER